PSTSATRLPLRVLRRYSPCTLRLVRVALPFGAHFQIASATHTRVLPLNALVSTLPLLSAATRRCASALALSTDKPARQLLLSPTSPPVCAVNALMPAPLRELSLPGKLRPRPSSAPSSMYWSVGASQ